MVQVLEVRGTIIVFGVHEVHLSTFVVPLIRGTSRIWGIWVQVRYKKSTSDTGYYMRR